MVTAVHIKEWTRFEELMFILEASMKDIVERWADGKVRAGQGYSLDRHECKLENNSLVSALRGLLVLTVSNLYRQMK